MDKFLAQYIVFSNSILLGKYGNGDNIENTLNTLAQIADLNDSRSLSITTKVNLKTLVLTSESFRHLINADFDQYLPVIKLQDPMYNLIMCISDYEDKFAQDYLSVLAHELKCRIVYLKEVRDQFMLVYRSIKNLYNSLRNQRRKLVRGPSPHINY